MARRWENQSRMALTGDREDNVGTVAMRQVSTCSDASGWTRRWGSARGSWPCSLRGKKGLGEETLGRWWLTPFNGGGRAGGRGHRSAATVGR
jgi:hypothetical protein